MFNNPYANYSPNYNQQVMNERIDNQIAQLQQMKEQMRNGQQMQPAQHQPTSINQTFQLAPNGNGGVRYVNSIDDVSKETVFMDTPFFSKDLSVVWIKNSSGSIKAYELTEIIEKDEKDMQIEFLTARLNQLEGMIKNEQFISNANEKQISTDTSTNDVTIGESIEKSESTGVSRISTSKKK